MAVRPDGGAAADPARALLRISDRDGTPRGLGFVADHRGTVLTAHQTVAGLDRIVLRTPCGLTRVLDRDSVLLLPGQGLALLRTEDVGGLPTPPLPIATGAAAAVAGRLVAVPGQLPSDGDGSVTLLQGGVLGHAPAGHTSAGHTPAGALLLDLPRLTGPPTAGAPVLDAENGAVLGVVCPAPGGPRPAGARSVAVLAAVPAGGEAEVARLLARNAAGVPGYGRALNLAGVLRLASAQLAAASAGPAVVAELAADRVDRPDGLVGEEPQAAVTVLLGAPGSGRSTELAALAVRRAGSRRALPTLWLRGADLEADLESAGAPGSPGAASGPADQEAGPAGAQRQTAPDAADRTDRWPVAEPLADAVGRALAHATRLLAADLPGTEHGPDPAEVARLCSAAHRPLLVLLDAPEEAPALLDAAWLREATSWLESCGARLLTACGPDAWEQLAPGETPPVAAGAGPSDPPRVHRLGPLPAPAADRARGRHGLPEGWPGPADARHPLALRLAGELRSAGVQGAPAGRGELFSGCLDLRCLAVARRIEESARPRRTGAHRRGGPPPAGEDTGRLRRLAVAVAGRVHGAARRMLGPGHGALSRDAFEELFPIEGGWAAAVLAERVFVPAGRGYRIAHEEFSDWLLGLHLDLDPALRLLLAEPDPDPRVAARPGPPAPAPVGVPRHRAGPVLAALSGLGPVPGAAAPGHRLHRLHRLLRALELEPPGSEPAWWAGRLLAGGLAAGVPAGPEAAAHRALLTRLAERTADRAREADGSSPASASTASAAPDRFGPDFWTGLALPPQVELDLLRRLVRADGPERRFLAVAARRLRADPAAVIPLLCAWFDDRTPLPAAPGLPARTVADLAQELLHTHRGLALDDLTEHLVRAAHPRADALLALLAADEPSAVCRAVDRWSHDPRPERHVAAAAHALRAAPYARGTGPELLRHTALALLAREDEPALHGAALALLVREPQTRPRHLAAALAAYRAGDPYLTAGELGPALESHPETVLAALAARLVAPDAQVGEGLRVLASASAPLVLRRATELAAALLRERPEQAGEVAGEYLEGRLRRLPGPAGAPADLRALLEGVVTAGAAAVRRVFAETLAAPQDGAVEPPGARARAELLAVLVAVERDPQVLTAVLECLAEGGERRGQAGLREVVALVAAALPAADEVLVRCAGHSAGFAALIARWPDGQAPAVPAGPRLARLRALVAAGRDPQGAAAQVGRETPDGAVTGVSGEPSGAGRPRPRRPAGLPVPNQRRAHGTL